MANVTRKASKTTRAAKKAPAKKSTRSTATARKAAGKSASKAVKAAPRTSSDLPAGLALSWGVQTPGRRGPKPAFTVAQVVSTSVRIADRDGSGSVSMPRVAEALGLTTSALYRYVRDKDELVVLMLDSALGTPPDAVKRSRSWRSGASAWAKGMVDRLVEHPWALEAPSAARPTGPNGLAWSEAFVSAMERSGLSVADRLSCAATLEAWARGAASARHAGGVSLTAAQAKAVDSFLADQADAQNYPALAGVVSSGYAGLAPAEEFGLERVLDGISAYVDKKS